MIDYIENPEKTVSNQDMQDFFDVFSYVKNPLKTNEGEYVSAVNCLKETALQQMILTKKQYQKTGRYIAWHGYQSFRTDGVTPGQCHETGLKLAREMWGDKYQYSGMCKALKKTLPESRWRHLAKKRKRSFPESAKNLR